MYTSTESVVIKVAEALYVTVEPEEIEISHKINRGKSILVKFCSHKTKSKIYKERTKLKHVKIKDIFPDYPSTARHRIFINEHLTAFQCLDLRREAVRQKVPKRISYKDSCRRRLK